LNLGISFIFKLCYMKNLSPKPQQSNIMEEFMRHARSASRLFCAALAAAFIFTGVGNDFSSFGQTVSAAEEANKNVYQGPVVGRSNKAKTISITVGRGDDAKTMMVRFDDDTQGLEFAQKGEAAIIKWEQRGDDRFATVIEPKLAKLPEGVTEIQVEELNELIQNGTPLTLVDARPEMRFNQAHLPGSINIPVPMLKEKGAAVLPEDKDKLLIFYCGGYT
jgi:hypothetical protein